MRFSPSPALALALRVSVPMPTPARRYVTDFDWLVEMLCQLAREHAAIAGESIGRHLLDVAIRVPTVQANVAAGVADIVADAQLVTRAVSDVNTARMLGSVGCVACVLSLSVSSSSQPPLCSSPVFPGCCLLC